MEQDIGLQLSVMNTLTDLGRIHLISHLIRAIDHQKSIKSYLRNKAKLMDEILSNLSLKCYEQTL